VALQDKQAYLKMLELAGVPVIPSVFLYEGLHGSPLPPSSTGKYVVKVPRETNGSGVWLGVHPDRVDTVVRNMLQRQSYVILQPHLRRRTEAKYCFVCGELSGDPVVTEEAGSNFSKVEGASLAERAFKVAVEAGYATHPFFRVDIMMLDDNTMVVNELESLEAKPNRSAAAALIGRAASVAEEWWSSIKAAARRKTEETAAEPAADPAAEPPAAAWAAEQATYLQMARLRRPLRRSAVPPAATAIDTAVAAAPPAAPAAEPAPKAEPVAVRAAEPVVAAAPEEAPASPAATPLPAAVDPTEALASGNPISFRWRPRKRLVASPPALVNLGQRQATAAAALVDVRLMPWHDDEVSLAPVAAPDVAATPARPQSRPPPAADPAAEPSAAWEAEPVAAAAQEPAPAALWRRPRRLAAAVQLEPAAAAAAAAQQQARPTAQQAAVASAAGQRPQTAPPVAGQQDPPPALLPPVQTAGPQHRPKALMELKVSVAELEHNFPDAEIEELLLALSRSCTDWLKSSHSGLALRTSEICRKANR
jgi:hypothetical protein